jgi:hypothetical protein
MQKEGISRLFLWKSVERNDDPVRRVLLPGNFTSTFLDEFAKLRKAATICITVRLFVCIEQLGSHWTYFHEI